MSQPTTDTPDRAAEAVQGSDIDGVMTLQEARDTFPIVGIGASAGGLQAFQEFFAALPAQPDMAFVLTQHLSPDHESALAELIQTHTQMAVTQIDDHPDVEPNRVYVIPPGEHMEIEDGHLRLVEARRDRGRPTAVDHFFRTLADDAGERAVCIVLSGTGSDGSLGLKAVKERGGLTMAQTPGDAEHGGMPQSAIDTGLVDVQGTATELAQALIRIRDASRLIVVPPSQDDAIPENDHQALQAIFAHLRERTAHDFVDYKRTTILRRLARRLQMTGQPDLPSYAQFLRDNADEVQALLRDFLISVTQFFRDPDAFETLEREMIPALFKGKTSRDQVRVWVAGCATGEEAYSIAMLLCEYRERLDDPPDIQVFATDIDEQALQRAREGRYAEMAAADVSAERLRRFFHVGPEGIRVKPELRQMVLFALHNLLSDPPFSRLDSVTCRNVLIYFNRPVQERLFATFHYALRKDGWLFLGAAEGPALVSKGFSLLDRDARLYTRRDVPGTPRMLYMGSSDGHRSPLPAQPHPDGPPPGVLERYREWTLAQYAPPRLLVDANYDITHIFGNAGDYLVNRDGPVSQNVIDKVLRAVRVDLRVALFQAFSSGIATDTRFCRVEVGERERVVRLHVGPVGGEAAQDGLAEVVFIELDPATVASLGAVVREGDEDGRMDEVVATQLGEELRQARARLHLTVEESEASTDELRASNEELQSTTEELETSKEELRSKIDEMLRLNSDLQNLIASTEIATVFLDRTLRLQRFTPCTEDLFHVLPTDIGRPFAHVTNRIRMTDLIEISRGVMASLIPVEHEVERDDGRWYILRVAPYRTTDDGIDGLVLTFIDVTDLRQAREEASRRAGHQGCVARLGLAALEGADPEDLFAQACQGAIECLGVDFAEVLQHRPDRSDLLLVMGTGWQEGIVGQATVTDSETSQAGFTLVAPSPVIVPDLASETRFATSELLTSHGVESGISVPIPGPDGVWGVLGLHSKRPSAFTADEGQFVQAIANILLDALRRERNEGTIRTQLSEIEAIYDTAPVGLAFYDRNLRFRRINERLASINGARREDHIGKSVREVLPHLADQLEPILKGVLATGEPVIDREVWGEAPSQPGDVRTWLCSYVPDLTEAGEVAGVSVVVRDITERKRVEDELASTLAELAFVLGSAHLGVWSHDLVAKRLTLDPIAQQIMGMEAEITTEQLYDRIHPDDREASREVEKQSVADPETPAPLSCRLRVRDEWRHIDMLGRYDSERGRHGGITGIVRDVTDLRSAELELRTFASSLESRVAQRTLQVRGLAADLARAEETERQRIAILLHDDLQQLLFGVQVKVSLLGRSIHDDDRLGASIEETRVLLDQAIDAARTLAVDLSPPVLHDEGLMAALEWVAHRIREAHGLTVHLDGADTTPLHADLQALVVRSVRELLFNTAKHAGVEEARVRISGDGDTVKVEVSDAGAGFDTSDTDLHGFGLTSIRRRLTLVGGDLSIESAPGTGTRAVLTCPTHFEEAATLTSGF